MQSTSGGLALKRRPKAKSVEPLELEPFAARRSSETEIVQQVISIPIEKLHRHASNRTIPKESVAELVQSLQDHGQREPIRVREHPDKIGHYEIISGERRFVAAQQVTGIDSLNAIVEAMTDSNSIVELAVANAARKDLDPIERAELLAELIKPVAEGGGGMDRDAAGRVFGLNSESGVKNTLRLLKLPEYFRHLLATGQIAIGKIRPLCAYPDAFLSKLAEWVQKNLKGSSCNYHWVAKRWVTELDGETERLIQMFVRDCTRPVGDKRFKHDHGFQLGWEHPCLFDITKLSESDRTDLQIVEIPDGKKGVRSVAFNTKFWHKLQDPLVAAKVKSKSAPPKESAGMGTKAPTAAELKKKRQKQDDQLQRYTDEWRCKALRCTMANRTPSNVVLTVIPWMLNAIMYQGNCFRDLYTWATCELVGSEAKGKRVAFRSVDDTADDSMKLQQLRSAEWWITLWRVALWPVATRTDHDSHVGLATIGTIPDRLPSMAPHDVHELAAAIDVSMETVWARAAEDGWERSLVLRWLEYHTREQLIDLAKSLKVQLKSDKRGAMAAELLEHHRVGHGRQLHLPAALSTPKVTKGKRGVR